MSKVQISLALAGGIGARTRDAIQLTKGILYQASQQMTSTGSSQASTVTMPAMPSATQAHPVLPDGTQLTPDMFVFEISVDPAGSETILFAEVRSGESVSATNGRQVAPGQTRQVYASDWGTTIAIINLP